MRLSDKGAHLIQSFEGFRSCPYRDAVGVWTIGYGSTKGVNAGTKCITQQAAHDRMVREIDERYGAAVRQIPGLNQNQFDALVSFVYNVGPGGISSSTGIGKALRAKDWTRAADELLKWDKAGGKALPGLTRRRKEERALFLSKPPSAQRPEDETRWMREYDTLLKQKKDIDRRRVLRRTMTARRKNIWRAAQKSGWDKLNRRARYKSLLARTT